MAGLSPMMAQYMETKNNIVTVFYFIDWVTFYEMFFDDALTASKELEITLTGKECGLEERAPMCGVPYHANGQLFKPSGAEGIQGCHRRADGGSEAGKGAGKA